MSETTKKSVEQKDAEAEIENFRQDLGPSVVAAETTRMAMVFTDATTTSISTVRRRNRKVSWCSTCRSTNGPTPVGKFCKPRNGSRNFRRERRTWEREPRLMQLLGLAADRGALPGEIRQARRSQRARSASSWRMAVEITQSVSVGPGAEQEMRGPS